MILGIELERDRFRAGDVVRGQVVVHQGGRLRELSVLLSYAERTTDFVHRLVTISSGALWRGDVQSGARLPFALQLPTSTYPNAVTPWGELAWSVEARADIPWSTDVHERRRIEVEHSVAPATAATGAAASAAASAAPGWYPQPDGTRRYWDGTRWTEHVAGG